MNAKPTPPLKSKILSSKAAAKPDKPANKPANKPVSKPNTTVPKAAASKQGQDSSKTLSSPPKLTDAGAKALVKTPIKKPVKTPVKTASKSVAKILVQADSKAAVKAPTPSASKPVAKASPQASTKLEGKKLVKADSQLAAQPEFHEVSKKTTQAVAKTAPKKSAPDSAKSSPRIPAEPAPLKLVNATNTSKPAAKSVSKVPTKLPATPVPISKATGPSTTVVTPKQSMSSPAVPAAIPQKSGRPSARLAQLTVPSMAQSVASTAAKASYSPAFPESVITPVAPVAIKKDPKLVNNWKTKPVADLTDAELLAMPDEEYMNEVQMAAFRLKLVNFKKEILNSAGETTEHLREDTSVVPDPADRATIEEEHALELRTRDRERKLLKKIEQSIARIDAGEYGYCDETGEPIGVGRLLARPTANLTLEAQQRRELKQKMFGD